MRGSGAAVVGLAALLVVAELYLLNRFFVRDRGSARAGCAEDRRCELGHIVMAAAMIGMFVPVLNPLPPVGWGLAFLAGAGWFTVRACRAIGRRAELAAAGIPGPAREFHHVIANLAMVYLVLVLPMPMPGTAASPASPHLTAAFSPAPIAVWTLTAYFLGQVAFSAYRIAVPVSRQRAAADVPSILRSPRALSGCEVVIGVGMTYMLG